MADLGQILNKVDFGKFGDVGHQYRFQNAIEIACDM